MSRQDGPDSLGQRLRAYRMAQRISGDELAKRLGISRAALYRMEAGHIVKIETLQRLATVLGTSLSALMGTGVEHYRSAIGYIERMRQLEVGATRILAHFDPISILLASDEFTEYLGVMLRESQDSPDPQDIDALLALLRGRKAAFKARAPTPVISLVGLWDLERFVHFGLVGRMGLPTSVRMERMQAARREVERIATLMESQDDVPLIGVVERTMPSSTFQVFERPDQSYVAISPYRFANFPNISSGIASVTSDPNAVALYRDMVDELWAVAHKGAAGAQVLRRMLQA